MAQEVEVKFRIADIRLLSRRLKAAGFKRVTRRTLETNTLYDFADHRLQDRGELLRLRKYGTEWLLTHKAKGKIGVHKIRTETESKVEEGGKLEVILLALGLLPSFRYEKFRSEWSDGRGHVVIDETPIGSFGEIEGRPRWIDATARGLGILPECYIVDTYAGLFFAWKKVTGSLANEMTFKAVKPSARRQTAPN